jgi:hypothetical protein
MPKRLALPADAAVEFVAPNHVLYVMQSALFGQSFDPQSLTLSGDPLRIAEQITVDAAMNRAAVSASAQVHSSIEPAPVAVRDNSSGSIGGAGN